MENIKRHLELLGMRVEDRVTGFHGVITSICFDLYGCVQATVHPGRDRDGKLQESVWLDVNRLRILDTDPVMEQPEFDWSPEVIASGGKGPADRPKPGKV